MALQNGINVLDTDLPGQSSSMTVANTAFELNGDGEMIWTPIEGDEMSAMDISAMDVSVMEITNYTIMDMSVDEVIEETPIVVGTVDDPPLVRLYASSDNSARHELTLEVAILPENEENQLSLSEIDTSLESVPPLTGSSSSSSCEPNSSSSDSNTFSNSSSSSSGSEGYMSVPKRRKKNAYNLLKKVHSKNKRKRYTRRK